MAAVIRFVQIQAEHLAARHNTDRCCQRLSRVVIFPVAFNAKLFYIADFVHLQKRDPVRDAHGARISLDRQSGQLIGEGADAIRLNIVQRKWDEAIGILVFDVVSGTGIIALNDGFAGFG